MTGNATGPGTQVYRVYIKAPQQAVWDAITQPEWNKRYGYQAPGEYELRPGGAYRGLASDGMVGPRTLEAARRADARALIRRLSQARLDFLSRLSTWPTFGRGWRRRVLAVERAALALAQNLTKD